MVTRLAEANFDRIKSVNGFVNGIIKRVKLDGPDRGGAGKVDMLPRTVRHRLEDLIHDVSAVPRCAAPCCAVCCLLGRAVCAAPAGALTLRTALC